MSNWVGYAVSVNCGEPLGCYQGTIIEADGLTISLTKPFRNGFPYPKSQVTLNAADIKELKIIEARPEPSEQTHSTVPVTKTSRRTPRATVCENLQANHTGNGHNNGQSNNAVSGKSRNSNISGAPVRSKPIDIQANNRNNKNNSHNNNNHSGSYGGGGGGGGGSGSTPRGRGAATGGGGGRGEHARRRNEACFGAPLHTEPDFDFEKNLALFDKQALWEQMRASGRPDVVPPQHNYAPTENVLGSSERGAALWLPAEWRATPGYVTDEGRRLPAASPAARRRLWEALREAGLHGGALVLLARAAADVALRLVGGERRLEARNLHQQPALTVRVAEGWAAGAGLAAARLLASHTARVALVLPPLSCPVDPLAPDQCAELSLCEAGVRLYREGDTVPRGDLLLQFGEAQGEVEAGGEEAVRVCVEAGSSTRARATVWALWPGSVAPQHGHVYLANVAPPPTLFAQLGARYSSPFGAASLLTLHPDDTL